MTVSDAEALLREGYAVSPDHEPEVAAAAVEPPVFGEGGAPVEHEPSGRRALTPEEAEHETEERGR